MAIIYQVNYDDRSPEYFPVESKACVAARKAHKDTGCGVYVEKCETVTAKSTRELFCILLSGTGWAATSETILDIKARA